MGILTSKVIVVLMWSFWCVATCSLENVWFRFANGPQSSVRGQYYLCKDALRYLQRALEELLQSQNLEKEISMRPDWGVCSWKSARLQGFEINWKYPFNKSTFYDSKRLCCRDCWWGVMTVFLLSQIVPTLHKQDTRN